MFGKELKSLPADTVRLIGSSQVIASVFSVVKELTENAFDAACTSLEVKLENYGLDKVEVRDNGFGIKKEAITMVAKRHHTSKISSFSDLECLETYGFRGEALGSLCAVSTLSITSKTAEEDVSHTYTFDNHGNVVSKLPSHLGQGTTICAVNIFKNMPVRRQFYNTVKKKKEELKKIEDLLMAYGVIRPDMRIILKNNKDIVWQKSVHTETRNVLLGIFGRNAVLQMEKKVAECSDSKVLLEAYLPTCESEVNVTSRSTNDRCFLAINKRPVQLKDIEKVVKQHYCQCMNCDGRHPMFYISVTVPAREIDVNVDPNKTKVMLHQQTSVLQLLTSVLEDMYGPIQKLAGPEKIKAAESLNDSTLSNLSSDSSFHSTSFEKTDFSGRHCLKEKNYNTDGSLDTHFKSWLPSGKSDRITDLGQSVEDAKSCEKRDKIENVSNGSDKTSEGVTQIHATGGNNMELGNKLVVYHTGINLSNNSGGNTVYSSKKCADEENMKDVDTCTTGSFLGKVTDCSHSHEKSGNSECDGNIQTQIEKGNFDILDDDLEELLRTQSSTTGITCGTPEILNNTDDMLAELDISMVGDIGEVGKKVDNVVKHVEGVDMGSKHLKDNKPGVDTTGTLDWSKGRAQVEKDCVPVQLLASGSHVTRKRPASPNQDLEMLAVTPPVKRKSTESLFDQPKLYDMVGKSPAEKYPFGFLAFSKEVRPKVLEDNPDFSYDEITAMVKRQWQQLPDLDKRQFEDVGKSQVLDLKKKVSERKRLSQKIDKRLKVNGTPSIKDQLLASSKKSSLSQNVAVKSVKLSFCLQTLQQTYLSGLRQTQTQVDRRMKLIGPLKFYNSWLCCHGNKLQIINPHRVEETLLYRELMDNHIIPATKLDNTIGLTESSVGGADLYGKLLEMVPSNTAQTYVYIEDIRLKANGFEIRCHMDQNSSPVLEMVGLATCMPMYGVRDLQEILELILNPGATTVYQARPLKVSFYLQGEAVRMVRQRPVHRSREDMLELLEQMDDSLPTDCASCLHNKPFKQTVYDLNNIPASQKIP